MENWQPGNPSASDFARATVLDPGREGDVTFEGDVQRAIGGGDDHADGSHGFERSLDEIRREGREQGIRQGRDE